MREEKSFPPANSQKAALLQQAIIFVDGWRGDAGAYSTSSESKVIAVVVSNGRSTI